MLCLASILLILTESKQYLDFGMFEYLLFCGCVIGELDLRLGLRVSNVCWCQRGGRKKY